MDNNVDILPYINNLMTGGKRERRNALESIYKTIFEREKPVSEPDLQKLFEDFRLHLLKTFSDPMESCREFSIDIARGFITNLPVNNYYLTYIIPLLVRRIGQVEIIEPCEELRLKLVILLKLIVERYANRNQLSPFYEDFINIMLRTLKDNFPQVLQESCIIILKLAEYLQRDFHMRADALVQPLGKILDHRHSKLRALAVEALGNVCMHVTKIEECWGLIGAKLLDSSQDVRLKVGQIGAKFLLEHRDRYSYWPRMLPLLLICLTDESESVVNECKILWEKVGAQYEAENESDYKNQMDYSAHLIPDRYPDGVTRPRLGCRVLIERNITRLVPPISRELGEWKPEMRLGAAKLLKLVVLHAEKGGTQAMSLIINAIVKGCINTEPEVIYELEKTCEIIGCLVPYQTWGPLIEPLVEDHGQTCHLRTLAHLLKGAQLPFEKKIAIGMILSAKEICRSRTQNNTTYLEQLLKCAENLLPVIGPKDTDISSDDSDIGYTQTNIYIIAMSALALCNQNEMIINKAHDVLNKILPDGDVTELHRRNLRRLLKSLLNRAEKFSGTNADCKMFETALVTCVPALCENWDIVLSILAGAFETEASYKITMFTTLAIVFLNWTACDDEANVLKKIVQDIIAPNLIWSAGTVAESCRTAAISSLCALMESAPQARPLLAEHSAALIQLLDEPSTTTRILALKVVALMPNNISRDILGDLYMALGKRLDDATPIVRIAAGQALGSIALIGSANTPKKDIKDSEDAYFINRSILLDIYKTALLHLDDRDPEIRGVMLESLKKLGLNGPRLLLDVIQTSRPLFRNKKDADILHEYLKSLL